MHVNLTFYYSITNYKSPNTLVFKPIRVNLTIKRFYPGNPGSNSTKLPSSTANPENINKTETPYTSTSKSTEEINPFILPIIDVTALDYISSSIPTVSAPTSFPNTKSHQVQQVETDKVIQKYNEHQQSVLPQKQKNDITGFTIDETTWFKSNSENHTFSKTILDNATKIMVPNEPEEIVLDFSEAIAVQKSSTVPVEIIGIKLKENARDAAGNILPSHELGKNAHVLIGQKNEVAGTIIADHILTSSKKNYVTGLSNTTLDTHNYKGENKPQRIAELQTGRIFLQHDENQTFEVKKDATEYFQQDHIKKKVEVIISMSPKRHHTIRPHKDEPELYTEDGFLHSEKEKLEQEPSLTSDIINLEDKVIENKELSDLNKKIDDINDEQHSFLEVD